MPFTPKSDWADSPATTSPITKAELDRIEAGVAEGARLATETLTGNVELATTAEMTAGTDATRVPPVSKVASYVTTKVNTEIAAHEADASAHPLTEQAISELQTSLGEKATLVDGLINIEQIPKSQSADADSIAQRDATGALSVASATNTTHAVTLGQANLLYGSDASEALVRDLFYAGGASSPNTTTFVKIPTVKIADGKTGDKWRCEYSIKYRASATAGISIQHSGNVAGVTNMLANPTFQDNASSWSKTFGNYANPVRSTVGGGQDGTSNMTMECTLTTGTQAGHYSSEWIETTGGSAHSAAAYLKWGSGTPKYVRIDIIYLLSTGLEAADRGIGSDGSSLGDNPGGGRIQPTTGAWTRVVNQNVAIAPSNVTHVKVRIVIESGAPGDICRVDAVQLEPTASVPAYGNTGGSGDALTFDGWWSGLTLSAPTADNYSRLQTYRTAATLAPCTFGGLGPSTDAQLIGSFVVDIGGTALLNQSIEFEFKQRVSDGVIATQIVSANATFVELP